MLATEAEMYGSWALTAPPEVSQRCLWPHFSIPYFSSRAGRLSPRHTYGQNYLLPIPLTTCSPKSAALRLQSSPSGFAQGYRKKPAEGSWGLSAPYICVVTLMARKLASQVWEPLDTGLCLNPPEIWRLLL